MKIENSKTENCVLSVEIVIDKGEFDKARHEAYMENTDRYPVIGKAPGLALLQDLEMTYGPAVLFDEALSKVIPDSFNEFLSAGGIRIMGKPEVNDMQFTQDGGVRFKVKADTYPEIELGQYLGISVPYRRSENQIEFEKAVIQKACENMKGEIPPHMIEQKLSSIVAGEKLAINNDAVYHLLADLLVILDRAYVAAGVSRPKVQVRREAMDLMLQAASAELEHDWKEYLKETITLMAERYHSLPEDFAQQYDRIIADRESAKSKRSADETTEEIFKAYLGSLELTEEQWKNQRQLQAAKEVCMDLLLDAVAVEESIEVSSDDIHAFIEELADRYGIKPEEAEANIHRNLLTDKLKRDKALALILNSGVTDEEAKKELDEARAEARKRMEEAAHIKE